MPVRSSMSLLATFKPFSPPNSINIDRRSITKEDNKAICAIPNEEEIEKNLFPMAPIKAPGPMVVQQYFFKRVGI